MVTCLLHRFFSIIYISRHHFVTCRYLLLSTLENIFISLGNFLVNYEGGTGEVGRYRKDILMMLSRIIKYLRSMKERKKSSMFVFILTFKLLHNFKLNVFHEMYLSIYCILLNNTIDSLT